MEATDSFVKKNFVVGLTLEKMSRKDSFFCVSTPFSRGEYEEPVPKRHNIYERRARMI